MTAIGTPWIWFNFSALCALLALIGLGLTLKSIYNLVFMRNKNRIAIIPGSQQEWLNFGEPKMLVAYIVFTIVMGLLSYGFMELFIWMATL